MFQFSSVTQSCPTIWDPMNCSTPGLPVHHQLPEFTPTPVHQVSDAIQPSQPLSSPFPPALNRSQHQSFPVSQLFAWGGQSTGVSALGSFLPKNTQAWSPLGWTSWDCKEKSLLQYHSSKASILWCSAFFTVQPSHPYMTTGKTIALTRWTFVGKVMSLLLNVLSRLVITFLPRSKRLNFMAAVTICRDFGAQENKICHCFHLFPLLFAMGLGAMILSFFECWVSSQLFHSHLSPSSKGSLVSLRFLLIEWYHLHIWGYWYFSQQSWFQLVICK